MKRYLLLLVLQVAACRPDQPAATSDPAALGSPPSRAATPAAPAAFTPPTGRLRLGDTDHPTDHDTLHVPGGGVLYLRPSTAAAFEWTPTELAWEADQHLTTTNPGPRRGQRPQGPARTTSAP